MCSCDLIRGYKHGNHCESRLALLATVCAELDMSSGKHLLTIVIFMFQTTKGTEVFATCFCYLLECQVVSGLYQSLVKCDLNSKM